MQITLVQLLTKLRQLKTLGLVIVSLMSPMLVHAIEFRSVGVEKSILYDAPSTAASKTFILNKGYPVEVIVNLGEWIKVRDHFGALNWIQNKDLTTKKTAIVLNPNTAIKQTPAETGNLVATVDKDVLVEIVSSNASNGWVKVRHRDGVTGYVLAGNLWGI
jgi:SH3-like domain-containing protein